MNGSRSNPQRPGSQSYGERSSLDALNRTIEGLEARIEGLMGSAARDVAPRPPERDRLPTRNAATARDAVAEIMQRQRSLSASREQPAPRERMPQREPERFAPERPAHDRFAPSKDRFAEETRAQPRHVQPQRPPQQRPSSAANDIAEALVGLRQDLKRDITDGLTREMNALRSEIRGIKDQAQDHSFAEDVRGDMQRLADSIQQLGRQASPAQADALRGDFDDLRAMIDGLAREDSMRRMENRWSGVEDRLNAFDRSRDDELVALAFRLDDIKSQIGSLKSSPAVDALDDKLVAVAQAVEMLGRQLQPDDRRMVSQFADIDSRLDEISRAIAANSRTTAALDGGFVNRLEGRLGALSSQIDSLRPNDSGIGARLEALTARVEGLASEKAAARLEERLDQLSLMMEHGSRTVQPELSDYLSDISRKIEALDQGSVNDALAERLDYLARRIDELDTPAVQPDSDARFDRLEDRLVGIAQRLEETQAAPYDDGSDTRFDRLEDRLAGIAQRLEETQAAPYDDGSDTRFDRLEDRLAGIAQRLEETQAAPFDDNTSLRNLETQIADLSVLVSQPRADVTVNMPAEFENRMNALEDYFSTSDEYIVEAARQAAEAVMEAYSRNGSSQVAGGDIAALSALAEELRTLENLSRSSDERTARTFEALHETLVHIADKLERIENREPAAPVRAEMPAQREAAPMPKAAPAEFNDAFGVNDLDDRYEDLQRDVRALQAEDQAVAVQGFEPAKAFAEDHPVSTVDLDEARAPAAAARPGLLAGLSKRFSGKRSETAPEQVRQFVEPTPSIDPSEMLAPEEANQLLEPGSGVPDVKKILERVRTGQMNKAGIQPADGDKDFIAAARRAAQLAVEEADTLNKGGQAGGAKGIGGAFARHRRPILMAVGAVLLAIMSYPLVSTMLSKPETAPVEPVAIIEQQAQPEAQKQKIAEDLPQTAVTTPAETPLTASEAGSAAALDSIDAPAAGSTVAVPATAVPTTTFTTSNEAPAPTFEPVNEAKPAPQAAELQPAPVEAARTASAPAAGATAPAPALAPVSVPSAIALPDDFGPAALVTAAKGGDPLAFYEIGARFTEGRGVSENMTEAAKWYQRAADAGVVPAQYRLASMYEKGAGVTRDAAKAKTLYLAAAGQGNASAMHNLAVMLASGRDGSPDFAEATKWFAKAAELGIRDSQFNLAVLYARGNGVPQDLTESYKWFAAAASEGDTDAAAKRDEVGKAMKPEQLQSAKAKAEAWKVQPVDAKANTVDVPDAWVGPANKTASVDMTKAIRNIQAILNNNGFDAGKPDGQMGKKTTAAIKAFQKSVGQEPTGEITEQLVKELLKRNS